MRNAKALLLLALAVVFGLAAAFYATTWLAQRGNMASSKVAVAAVDIELGSKITPQMITVVDWPATSVPPGAFTATGLLSLHEFEPEFARWGMVTDLVDESSPSPDTTTTLHVVAP